MIFLSRLAVFTTTFMWAVGWQGVSLLLAALMWALAETARERMFKGQRGRGR